MKVQTLPIPQAFVLEYSPYQDSRGYFTKLFSRPSFSALGHPDSIEQVNLSFTATRGTFRGLHYQIHPQFPEHKFVQCLRGKVFDVLVDLRVGSPVFLQPTTLVLDGASTNAILIPAGVAHGFQTLTDECLLLYLHSAPYLTEHEGGIRYSDPRISLELPLPISEISERDAAHQLVDESFVGFDL